MYLRGILDDSPVVSGTICVSLCFREFGHVLADLVLEQGAVVAEVFVEAKLDADSA